MNIPQILNANIGDVENHKYNVFIGVSQGNKFFSEDNLRKYIEWGLSVTKDSLSLLIPDSIHSVNYEVRFKYTKERALKTALRKGAATAAQITEIVEKYFNESKDRINVLRWEDIAHDENYLRIFSILDREFKNNSVFHDKIIEIVKDNINTSIIQINDEDLDKLASYPVAELPVLINGFTYKGVSYNLIPYPGISKIDHFTVKMQNGGIFPEITKEIVVDNPVVLVEAYPEVTLEAAK